MTKSVNTMFLDFDGVVLESVDVKGWCFGMLFDVYGDKKDEIIAFHYANGGMSRFDKFRIIYRDILKEPLSEDRFNGLCQKFADLVFHRVLQCPYVHGVLEFLQRYHNVYSFFVVSATPHEEIIRIVDQKGLSPYLDGVFGAPTSKSEWTRQIIKERGIDVARALFIGDAMSDYRAARDNNIRFVGRIGQEDIFKDVAVYWKIRDFTELETLLSNNGD